MPADSARTAGGRGPSGGDRRPHRRPQLRAARRTKQTGHQRVDNASDGAAKPGPRSARRIRAPPAPWRRAVVGEGGESSRCAVSMSPSSLRSQVGGRDRGRERCRRRIGVGPAGVDRAGRGTRAQVAGDVRADVGRLGQPAAAVGAARAEVGRPEERGDARRPRRRAGGGRAAAVVEQRGNRLVRSRTAASARCQAPALRSSRSALGQRPVSGAPLAVGGDARRPRRGPAGDERPDRCPRPR